MTDELRIPDVTENDIEKTTDQTIILNLKRIRSLRHIGRLGIAPVIKPKIKLKERKTIKVV